MLVIVDFLVVLVDVVDCVYLLNVVVFELGFEIGWLWFFLFSFVEGIGWNGCLCIEVQGDMWIVLGLVLLVFDLCFQVSGLNGLVVEEMLVLWVWWLLGGVCLLLCMFVLLGSCVVSIVIMCFVILQVLFRFEIFLLLMMVVDYVLMVFWENENVILVYLLCSGLVCVVICDVDLVGLLYILVLVMVGYVCVFSLNFVIGVVLYGKVDEDGFWQCCIGLWVLGLFVQGWVQVYCIFVDLIFGWVDLFLVVLLVIDVFNDLSWGLFCGFCIFCDDIQGCVV